MVDAILSMVDGRWEDGRSSRVDGRWEMGDGGWWMGWDGRRRNAMGCNGIRRDAIGCDGVGYIVGGG